VEIFRTHQATNGWQITQSAYGMRPPISPPQ